MSDKPDMISFTKTAFQNGGVMPVLCVLYPNSSNSHSGGFTGTGYYYERFRPGLITVLIFLIILTSGIQHIIQRYNRTRDLGRIERFIRLGKATAYGPKGLVVEGKRKVRVPVSDVGDESGGGPRGGGGRMVDLLVDGEQVYLVRRRPFILVSLAYYEPRLCFICGVHYRLALAMIQSY
jgi:hypothetical protein